MMPTIERTKRFRPFMSSAMTSPRRFCPKTADPRTNTTVSQMAFAVWGSANS
jgi:hypothetical protein